MIFDREENASLRRTTDSTCISDTSNVSDYLVHSLPIEGCVYRGEGNANLVLTLPSERKVIRLKKSVSGHLKLEENVRDVFRKVEFLKDVISTFFGCYVCVPEILHLDQSEIDRLSEKIRQNRPENRRSKDIIGGYIMKFPDYTFLPEDISGCSNKSTFSVEIKPKQGYLCKADQEFKKCPYCLTQYYKSFNGRAKQISDYCPFDLFSGKESRMNHALEALLFSPQNNLRIFKDGNLVYDEELAEKNVLRALLTDWFSSKHPLKDFLELVRRSLLLDFDIDRNLPIVTTYELADNVEVPSRLEPVLVQRVKILLSGIQECDLSSVNLPTGSALERILRMQKLHRCGLDIVAWIRTKFSAILTDEIIYNSFFRNGTTNSSVTSNVGLIEEKKKQLHNWIDKDDLLKYKTNVVPHLSERNSSINKKKEQILNNKIISESLLKNITVDDIFNIVKNYLIFCTAKDCSIIMAFQEVNKNVSTDFNSQHIIEVSRDQSFLVSIRILDLDMKGLLCIEKHCIRDNNVLQATVEELQKKINLLNEI